MKSKQKIEAEVYKLLSDTKFINRGIYESLAMTLNNVLYDDEDIKVICSCMYNNKRFQILCTDRRVFLVDTGKIPKRVEISIDDIDSILPESRALESRIHIMVKDEDYLVGNLTRNQKFINVLSMQMKRRKNNKVGN